LKMKRNKTQIPLLTPELQRWGLVVSALSPINDHSAKRDESGNLDSPFLVPRTHFL
jgi:hypothetical protein